MFPVMMDLAGRRVVVVGAGRVGATKARQLVSGGAAVTVISPVVTGDLPEGVELVARAFVAGDLAGAILVVSATGRAQVDDEVVAEARERNVLVNVVDDPGRSNVYFTAVHRDGELVVSVSTEGASPALARWVRDRVARTLPSGLGEVARRLRAERRGRHEAGESTEGLDWTSRIEREVGGAAPFA
jgi:precorrin-2 dehydrogenase